MFITLGKKEKKKSQMILLFIFYSFARTMDKFVINKLRRSQDLSLTQYLSSTQVSY